MSPARIQRRRTKGWRMPAGAVYVGRPSRWGNPCRVSRRPDGLWEVTGTDGRGVHAFFHDRRVAHAWAVQRLSRDIAHDHAPWSVEEIQAALAGRDLACWCPLDQPCHADLLLTIANQKEERR